MLPIGRRLTVRMLNRIAPAEPTWTQINDGLWLATSNGDRIGSIEETDAYGFVVKSASGDWLASFSGLSNAMWFLTLAEQARAHRS